MMVKQVDSDGKTSERPYEKMKNPNIDNYYPYRIPFVTTRRMEGRIMTEHCYDVLTEQLTHDANESLKGTEFAQNGGEIYRAYVITPPKKTFGTIRLEATQPLSPESKMALCRWVAREVRDEHSIILNELKQFNPDIEFDTHLLICAYSPHDGQKPLQSTAWEKKEPKDERFMEFGVDMLLDTALSDDDLETLNENRPIQVFHG